MTFKTVDPKRYRVKKKPKSVGKACAGREVEILYPSANIRGHVVIRFADEPNLAVRNNGSVRSGDIERIPYREQT